MAISVENRKFSHSRVFCGPTVGVLLGIGYRRWRQNKKEQKTRMMRRRAEKEVSRCLESCGQYTNLTDGQTDRQTDTGRQQRPRLGAYVAR